jgi:predicted metal-dependent HD superfamily phosphohydrolase
MGDDLSVFGPPAFRLCPVIYIDPPLWPAHNTVFSHLVSDTSVAELHSFAADAGIAFRAFDLDHYDVPLIRYHDLVERGAVEVDGGTLVRLLIRSGLRIKARERNAALVHPLLTRWDALLPGNRELGAELLNRWGEPHRRYHDRRHLLAVLEAVELLWPRPPRPGTRRRETMPPGGARAADDEEQSARLASVLLAEAGIPVAEIREVARLVRVTAAHAPAAEDAAGQVLCDADLSVLAREPAAYARYLSDVRHEYRQLADVDFAAGRRRVVLGLLALEPIFSTAAARDRWEEPARRNLASELVAVPAAVPAAAPSAGGGGERTGGDSGAGKKS